MELWDLRIRNKKLGATIDVYGYDDDVMYWDFLWDADEEDENVPSSASGIFETSYEDAEKFGLCHCVGYAFIEFDEWGDVESVCLQTMDYTNNKEKDYYFYKEEDGISIRHNIK